MTYWTRQAGFPDAIDNKGRWCEKDGELYKSIEYEGGNVRWVKEGTAITEQYGAHRLKFDRLSQLVEKWHGGPLSV